MKFILFIIGYALSLIVAKAFFGVDPTFWEAMWVIIGLTVGGVFELLWDEFRS